MPELTPQEEHVKANIELLLQMHLEGLSKDPAAQQKLKASIDKIRGEYQEAVSKDYKDIADSIANCLPNLVKGTKDAVDAFKEGDYISGSAALMDICASVIPVFASLSAAGGPVATLFGAVLSVVGQILSFFAPKQPSLEDKIQKMLDHLKDQKQFESITAFGHSVSSYISMLQKATDGAHRMGKPVALAGTVSLTHGLRVVTGTATKFKEECRLDREQVSLWLTFNSDTSGTAYKIDTIDGDTSLTLTTEYQGESIASSPVQQRERTVQRRSINDVLAMPLTTTGEAQKFLVQIDRLELGLGKSQAKLDAPVFASWEVAGYLENKDNWKNEGWPEVLGVWCRTYVDLLTANIMLNSLVDEKTVARLLIDTDEGNTQSPLPTQTRHDCWLALTRLQSLQGALNDLWASDKEEVLQKVVQTVRPVARERGLYAHIGWWAGSETSMYIARGNGKGDRLAWERKSNTAWLTSISIHVPRAQQDSYAPTYELLTNGYESDAIPSGIWRQVLNPVTGDLFDGTLAIQGRYHDRRRPNDGERFFDAAGIAYNDKTLGFDDSTHPLTLVALAIGNGPKCYLNYYTIDKDGKSTRVNTQPDLDGMKDVRCLYLPPNTLADDPDADAMKDSNAKPPGPPLLAQNAQVVYGGVRDRNVVHVVAWNSGWNSGDAVDGPENWTGYNGIEVDPYYLWVFGKGGIACATHASMIKCRQRKAKGDRLARPTWISHDFDKQFTAPEVISLYPCVDETLLVSMLGDIYTADYRIDRPKNGTSRIITSPWVQRGGVAKQLIKMPIPAWSVLESLRANLEESE
jgi:hypothetical protein